MFNNGNTGGTATVALTGTNTIAGGTALVITAAGSGNTSASTSATAGNGSATCSGTATVVTVLTGFSLTLTATGLTNFTVPVGTTTGAISGVDINTAGQVTATHLAAALPVLQGGTGLTAGSANKVLGGATPSYVTVTSAYVDNSIALTGTDINTSNQVTVTHLAAALPVAQGGTNCTSATVTCFNNITGFSAAGTTGTTSTNLVFSTSPTVTTPVFSGLTTVNGAGATSGTNALVITNSTPINTFVVRNDGLVTIQAGGTGADGVNTAPLRFITANSASDTADFVFSRAGNPHFYIVGSAVPWLGVGGDSSSFPALGRSGTALQAVLANDGSTLTSMNFSTISIANSSFSFNGHTCTIVSTVVTCP